jgi:diguanylate cyclase (GGDEF)-like protein
MGAKMHADREITGMCFLNHTKSKLARVIAIQKGYFIDSSKEIAVRNLRLMRLACGTCICFYLLYWAVTALFFREWMISPLYGLIVPILAVFLYYSGKSVQSENINVKTAQRATLLLYCALMAYAIVMSVFPHSNVPSAYYPLFLLMAPVIFILPAYQHILITGVSLVIFYVLVLGYKSPACWSHELFEATTAAVFSMVVIIFMTQFRLQSDHLKEKYYKLSRQDSLTGIVNKSTGLEIAQEYLDTAKRNEKCALLFVDIDSFKSFNDTFGHIEGDNLLTSLGATLSMLCRKSDIVCRFGGDEFIIVLKDVFTLDMVKRKAQNILDSVSRIELRSRKQMTCSIGIYFRDYGRVTVQEMIHRADIALYQAKNNGKNRYEVYTQAMGERRTPEHTPPVPCANKAPEHV